MSATELEIILITVTHNQMEMKRVAAFCRTAADAAQCGPERSQRLEYRT
jgi:hypothetical protein